MTTNSKAMALLGAVLAIIICSIVIGMNVSKNLHEIDVGKSILASFLSLIALGGVAFFTFKIGTIWFPTLLFAAFVIIWPFWCFAFNSIKSSSDFKYLHFVDDGIIWAVNFWWNSWWFEGGILVFAVIACYYSYQWGRQRFELT